jgi:hypothetical protein
MTDKRKHALEQIRAQKNSRLSQLDQMIQEQKLKDKYESDDNTPVDDDNFVVDEEGNAVRYDNDEEEEYEDVEKVQMGGQIMKYLGNMHQGKKIAQIKKVSKAVLKKNEQNINDLMNQVGENEDDSSSENPDNNKISNKKNQPNIDYEMMEDYQPAYSKQKKETEIKDNSLDNNIESLDQSIDIESENKNKPKKTK